MTAIEGQMVSGEKEIHMPSAILHDLRRMGNSQPVVAVKLCIDTGGAVSSVDVTKSCGNTSGDESIVGKVRAWRFRPYTVNGIPVPVCTVKLFRYIID
jgi:TonB family protein